MYNAEQPKKSATSFESSRIPENQILINGVTSVILETKTELKRHVQCLLDTQVAANFDPVLIHWFAVMPT